MEFQLKLCVFSAILMLCSSFGEAKSAWKDVNQTTVINRYAGSYGYFALPVDRTTFSVDEHVWLQQFDICKVFGYDPVNAVNVEHVPAKYEIVELTGDAEGQVIFAGNTELSSTHEVHIDVSSDIMLKAHTQYVIRLETSDKLHLMYNEHLSMGTYRIERALGKSITVNFYQTNPPHNPPSVTDFTHKLSLGMVKRLHLKYSRF